MIDQNYAAVEIEDSVLYQTVADEVVLHNIANQEYYRLDRVGAEVWQLLVNNQDVASVARRLASQYAIDEKTVLRDIESFISELLAAKLLKATPVSNKACEPVPLQGA